VLGGISRCAAHDTGGSAAIHIEFALWFGAPELFDNSPPPDISISGFG
jgi:hypothetical protein